MNHAMYKRFIQMKIDWINHRLGTAYKTNFCSFYGGWNLYEVTEQGGHFRGEMGFDYRKSSAEMLAYLEGVMVGMSTRMK